MNSTPSKMASAAYDPDNFIRPKDINISDAVPQKKPGHKREDSSPNSVTFTGSEHVPKVEGSYLPPAVLSSPKHVRHYAKQWRCTSPTDRFRVDQPFSILKRNYIRRYLMGESDSSSLQFD